MAETWPADVPSCFTVDSLEGAIADNLLRSQNDMGPAKTRRRGSSKPDPRAGVVKMTWAQWEALEAFVKETLLGGALVFDFPWRGGTVEARFREMPSFRRAAPGVYMVSLPLEFMP